MKSIKVKDLMVSLSDYATVSEDATLYEAVLALDEAQKRLHRDRHPHRAVLVLDAGGNVVGKLSQWDFIRALEPRYNEIVDFNSLVRLGWSTRFIRSMIEDQGLWQKPLDNLCQRASRIKVKDVMYTPAEGEYVQEDSTLDEGIHQLVIGHHQSLLVARDSRVVGVLRISDVFSQICEIMRSSQP
jgi:CBS domain-containing protein